MKLQSFIHQSVSKLLTRSVHIHFLLFDVTGAPPTGNGIWVPEENLDANSFPAANRHVIDLLKSFDKTRRPASEEDRE